MDQLAFAKSRTGSKGAVLLVMTLVIVLIVSLSRSLFYPIGYDQALYQYIADRVIAGQRMYADVWDQNWPGIVGIHWISTKLVGRTPLDLRLFDAGWQVLTLLAIASLGYRSEKRWSVGWLAALLYALAYYGTGFIHTAQREGFAVLPLVLGLHATLAAEKEHQPAKRSICLYGLVGIFCFTAFAIKPTLGLCFGVLWIDLLIQALHHRDLARRKWAGLLGMSGGFLLACGAGISLLMRLGWWEAFYPVLTRAAVPGYVVGPENIKKVLPYLIVGAALIIVIWILVSRPVTERKQQTSRRFWPTDWTIPLTAAIVFGFLVITYHWGAWGNIARRTCGLLLPAIGSVIVCTWAKRSRTWRLCLLLACAVFAGMVMQGWFFLYHFFPLFAFLAYMAAVELTETLGRYAGNNASYRAWALVCLAGVTHLAVDHWGGKMCDRTWRPSVLHNRSLLEYQTAIAHNPKRYPSYATTIQVARRIRQLTQPNDPIASLMVEPRLYYFAQRPPVYRLFHPQPVYSYLFDEFMEAIRKKNPPAIVARIPSDIEPQATIEQIEASIYATNEAYFGPGASVLRERYRLSEIIDDVCILQPTKPLRMHASQDRNILGG